MVSAGGRPLGVLKILRNDGPRYLAQRIARAAYYRLSASDLEFPLELDDIADSRALTLQVPMQRPRRGTPLTVGWVCTPPGAGSGGHTTLFRMIEAVEAAGHTCTIYLHDRFRGTLSHHEQVIRKHWPYVRARVRSVAEGLDPLDAYVAGSWIAAHILAARASVPTRRLYLIQDFEPFMLPHGSEYVLAEDAYRFGFRCIAVGWYVRDMLQKQFNVDAQLAEYGCDTAVYGMTNHGARSGVVFYAKPGVARRGFELGMLALREFHRRQPSQEIHVFGDARAKMPFPVTNHGVMTPAQLSQLYNRCRAGLAMSFTNVSLVAAEMLATGVIPVISGSAAMRADLDNPFARFADPSPSAIADELCAIVANPAPSPAEVAGSIRASNWDSAKRVTVETIEDEVYGPI